MDLYDVMTTTFSGREFTDDDVSDEVLYKILDNARFAPSGGNRQGWKVIVIREGAQKEKLAELALPTAQRYLAQLKRGENPFNTVIESSVTDADVEAMATPAQGMAKQFKTAPVLLVVTVDMGVLASMDAGLDRVGIISGASIYPFAWNILLGARHEGLTGVMTTMAVPQEAQVKEALSIPEQWAVACVIPLGKPVKQLTRLKRKSVEEFAVEGAWDGDALTTTAVD